MRARGRVALQAGGLALLFAALVACAYFLFERPRREEEARTRSEERVLPFAPAEVLEVRLWRGGGLVAALLRTPGGFAVRAGATVPADPEAAQAYLRKLASLRRGASLRPAEGGLGRYGLDPPRGRLEVALAGGRTLSLDLGDENPFDHSLFARAGDDVLRLPAAARVALSLDPGALRAPPAPDGGNRG